MKLKVNWYILHSKIDKNIVNSFSQLIIIFTFLNRQKFKSKSFPNFDFFFHIKLSKLSCSKNLKE
jgi:hypothetical protein